MTSDSQDHRFNGVVALAHLDEDAVEGAAFT